MVLDLMQDEEEQEEDEEEKEEEEHQQQGRCGHEGKEAGRNRE